VIGFNLIIAFRTHHCFIYNAIARGDHSRICWWTYTVWN